MVQNKVIKINNIRNSTAHSCLMTIMSKTLNNKTILLTVKYFHFAGDAALVAHFTKDCQTLLY